MCHNPLEPEISDHELRERYLAADQETRGRLAKSLAISTGGLDSWGTHGALRRTGQPTLPLLAGNSLVSPHQFWPVI